MAYIKKNFMVHNDAGRELYKKYAEKQPIIDYHNHLSPREIAEHREYENLYELWLEGDHYKWRAMRSNGVGEEFCTGGASAREKFNAFARTVPHTVRNPLYHWTHLELKRYFGINKLLGPDTADEIWEEAGEQLRGGGFSTVDILKRFRVEVLCTTDDPADSLEYHEAISNDSRIQARVLPAFRPDKSLNVRQPQIFNAWVDKLAATCQREIRGLSDLLEALEKRHEYFHEMGARVSDHGLSYCYSEDCTEMEASNIFDRARSGVSASMEEHEKYASYLMHFFGILDAKRGWTKQLHLGALRNNNSAGFKKLGPDVGFDSIGDWPQAEKLARYMDRLEAVGSLPRMILYNLNPSDNYIFGSMLGNFQDGVTAGKIQLGSGWWFLDQRDGMEWQLNTLSNLGLLSRFIGMLTDSRSFMSFPRHEYFRRILCNLVGKEVENGEIPDCEKLTGPLIENICYGNAKRYLGI